jgi:lipoate---protein ligase
MLALISQTNDIYFNLAAEEYLLKSKDVDIFMLWQSDACVVVGKHQNTLAEINYGFLRREYISVARRLTGGGTVYHGPGNLNFSFIRTGQTGKLVDFRYFVTPIVKYLKKLGIEAEIGMRNDLLVNGEKISGNAEHVFRQRVLHHGTLLFNADLEQLNRSIRTIPGRFRDKAVQSARSAVTNISSHLVNPMAYEEFKESLFSFLLEEYPRAVKYRLQEQEIKEIQVLRDTKYSSPGWIFGYSPDYEVKGSIMNVDKPAEITCLVRKGRIEMCRVATADDKLKDQIEKCLTGAEFEFNEVNGRLERSVNSGRKIKDSILEALFA